MEHKTKSKIVKLILLCLAVMIINHSIEIDRQQFSGKENSIVRLLSPYKWLNFLPESMLKQFELDGGTFSHEEEINMDYDILLDGIGEYIERTGEKIYGVYNNNKVEITVRTYSADMILHEFGHYWWSRQLSERQRYEYSCVFEEEKLSEYASLYASEAYAEAFRMYYNPFCHWRLKKKFPLSYDFVRKTVAYQMGEQYE